MPDDGFELNKEPQDSFSHLKVMAVEEPVLVRLSQMGAGTSGALGYTKIRNKRSPLASAGLTEGGRPLAGRQHQGGSLRKRTSSTCFSRSAFNPTLLAHSLTRAFA